MPFVIAEQRESILAIRLNNPAQRNALTSRTLDEIENLIVNLAARDEIKTIIFTGTNDAFASGADIRELQRLNRESARAFAARGQRLMRAIADAPQLTIAAVNGLCFGGGLDLALSCRKRIAAPAAVFAHPGATLGIITGWGGTQRLTRLIGAARATEMFFTARRVTAQEALQFGLVDEINSAPVERALEIATRN